MGDASKWVLSGAVAIMGLIGLFVAARGGQSVPYWGGLGFFLFSVLYVFYQIKLAFDEAEHRKYSHH